MWERQNFEEGVCSSKGVEESEPTKNGGRIRRGWDVGLKWIIFEWLRKRFKNIQKAQET
jgi:hypothetical protein